MREITILLRFLAFKPLALLELGRQGKILFSSLIRGTKPPLKFVLLFQAIMPEPFGRRGLTSTTDKRYERGP